MDKKYWIDVAWGDIEASAVLYENGNYPQALFYLQQSVEKCVKYVAISMMDFPENRLKKIGHESAKMFQEMAKTMYDIKGYSSNKWLNSFQKFKDFMKDCTENASVLLLIKELGNIAGKIQAYDQNTIKEYFRTQIEELRPEDDWDEIEFLYDSECDSAKELRKFAEDIYIMDCHFPVALDMLVMFSLFFSRFKVDDFRYPSEKYGNPFMYFNNNKFLVKELEGLISLMRVYVISIVKELNWEI